MRIITVNEKKPHHDCEMVFSFDYENKENGFEVDSEQKYRIHTTLKELALLNIALHLYQAEGFKDKYWLYTNTVDPSNVYPMFVPDYIEAIGIGKQLQALAVDEDSLVQLSEYCLETPPTYEDDFRINKVIHSVTVKGVTTEISDYEDIKDFLESHGIVVEDYE